MSRRRARSGRFARRQVCWRALAGLAVVVAMAPASVQAQTLGEVVLVSAIASQLHPVASLPSGSLRAEGPGAVALAARVPDAGAWTDWEVYTARGLAALLEPALVHNVETELMVAGFDRVSRDESTVEGERHVRHVFEGGGSRVLLYVIRGADSLVWLLARGR
jgi:hypothetical protein